MGIGLVKREQKVNTTKIARCSSQISLAKPRPACRAPFHAVAVKNKSSVTGPLSFLEKEP